MNPEQYTCILVDDETLAQDLIANHLERFPDFRITSKFNDPREALAFVSENRVDVIFLDIEMPGLNGMDFIRQLDSSPKIILTTAYSEFALEGFDLQVIDYLLKPVTLERFKASILKVKRLLKLEHELITAETTSEAEHLVIKSSHELVRIAISDILYVEGMHKYVKIVTRSGNYTTLFGLTALATELPSGSFYRCHRSFIVNVNHVDKISGNQVFIDKHCVPVSKGNKSELLEKMGKLI